MKDTNVLGKICKNWLWICVAILIVAIPVLFFAITFNSHVTIEAGAEFKQEMLWKTPVSAMTKVKEEVNTSRVGSKSYTATLFGCIPVMFELEVGDTLAPQVKTKDIKIAYGSSCKPEELVAECTDASQVTYAFQKAPNANMAGTQVVIVEITDASGNVTTAYAKVTVTGTVSTYTMALGDGIPDAMDFVVDPSASAEYVTEPDPILFTKLGEVEVTVLCNGVEEKVVVVLVDKTGPTIQTSHIKVTVNGSLSYKKNISITDNCDAASDIKLEIDNSGVDLSKIGSYKVVCKATDSAGNVTQKDITVEVVDTATEVHTLEEINRYCDNLLAQITNDSMTMREKAEAIYKWTYYNIAYVDNSPKGDWLLGAYNGIVKKAGDCFTFAATAKALLERIGLEPMVIRKEVTAQTSSNNHYWLLLDLGDGYYHFDPTRRKDRTEFFMWTDADLKAYSDAHSGSHNFTRSLYPKIQ